MSEEQIAGRVVLHYLGVPGQPDRRGMIPGITPPGGLKAGDSVMLSRDFERFAQSLVDTHNANRDPVRWALELYAPPEAPQPQIVVRKSRVALRMDTGPLGDEVGTTKPSGEGAAEKEEKD